MLSLALAGLYGLRIWAFRLFGLCGSRVGLRVSSFRVLRLKVSSAQYSPSTNMHHLLVHKAVTLRDSVHMKLEAASFHCILLAPCVACAGTR